jgi:hypothetical protein
VPREPKPRRHKTEDATVEKLSELLMENPRGILLHRDELSGWLRSLDKQGRGATGPSTSSRGTARGASRWTA